MNELVIESLLGEDIYVTLKGRSKEKEVVVKLFLGDADLNNEYNVLGFLQKASLHPEWFPKPYFVHLPNSGVVRELGRQWNKVYFAIVYEFIQGQTVDVKKLTLDERVQLRAEVGEQLRELHRLGLVHGDVRGQNIIKTPQRYLLIDYGRTYSPEGEFLALDFMIEDDFMVMPEDDLLALEVMTRV